MIALAVDRFEETVRGNPVTLAVSRLGDTEWLAEK